MKVVRGILALIMYIIAAVSMCYGIGIMHSAKSAMHEIFGAAVLLTAVSSLGFAGILSCMKIEEVVEKTEE